MRRQNLFGQLFGSIIKWQIDFKRGSLRFYSSGYDLSDKGYTNRQGVYFGPTKDQRDRPMSLNLKESVGCCPREEWAEKYPIGECGLWVPKSVCRKCEHYIKGRGSRAPRCVELVRLREDAPSPVAKVGEVIASANQKMKEFGL